MPVGLVEAIPAPTEPVEAIPGQMGPAEVVAGSAGPAEAFAVRSEVDAGLERGQWGQARCPGRIGIGT